MKAKELYKLLDEKFIVDGLHDVWYRFMDGLEDYICDSFKQTDMGLMCDFTEEIGVVYTAVFPSTKVMHDILKEGTRNALLFVHHACDWDSRFAIPFVHMSPQLLDQLKERNISIYCIHVPLDNYNVYSTGNSFTEALGLEVESKFAEYRGAQCGVIGRTPSNSLDDLTLQIEKIVDHKAVVYQYGEKTIVDCRVAVVTGGGNDPSMLQEALDKGVNTYVTGVTNPAMTAKAHEFAKKNKINIIGATHYSTEKFACIKMVDFFKELGLQSIFVEETPVLEDM